MTKTIHVINPNFKSIGKRQLMECNSCETTTLHTTPFLGFPFRCIANHEGTSLYYSCETYVEHVAKVMVGADGRHQKFCDLCVQPDSAERQQLIKERKKKAAEETNKPLDLNDAHSIARAFGASSFRDRR